MKQALIDEVAADTDQRLLCFLETRLNPGTAQRDADAVPLEPQLLREAAHLGLFQHAYTAPGRNQLFDPIRWGLVLEHLGYLCADLSFPLLVYLTAGMIRRIHADGRHDLLHDDLPLVGFAFTEQRDPFSLAGRLARKPGSLVVDTHKTIVAGAQILDSFLTYVPDEQNRPVAVLLHRTDPGVTCAPLGVSGFRSAGFGTLTADGAVVPSSRIVNTDGLANAQQVLNSEAAFFVAGPTGRMRAIAEACARHAAATFRHGTPIADYPNVQSLLGRIYAKVECCRSVLYRALDAIPQADPFWAPLSWTAKYTVSQCAIEVAAMAQRLVGTAGFLQDKLYTRHLHDFSGLLAGGNPQEKVEIDLGLNFLHTTNQPGDRQWKSG